jgi:hypothetical protein
LTISAGFPHTCGYPQRGYAGGAIYCVSEAIKQISVFIETAGESLASDSVQSDCGKDDSLRRDPQRSCRSNSSKFLRRIAKRFSRLLLTENLFDVDLAILRQQIAFYNSPALVKNPESFFRPPNESASILSELHETRADGEVLDLSFARTFEPMNSAYSDELAAHQPNNTVRARYWRHSAKPRGTIISIHGWLLGSSRLSDATLAPEEFYQQGFDVVLYELPLHGRRANVAERGITFPCADLSRTNEGFGQAIYELRQLRTYLLESGAQSIGVLGMSLGGYVASLWSGLDDLDFVICVSPLVKMAPFVKSILRKASIVSDQALNLKKAVQTTNLSRVYAMHSPLSYECRVAAERRLIVSCKHDRILPKGHTEALCSHWGGDTVLWAAGGHFNVLNKNNTVQRIISRLFPD